MMTKKQKPNPKEEDDDDVRPYVTCQLHPPQILIKDNHNNSNSDGTNHNARPWANKLNPKAHIIN